MFKKCSLHHHAQTGSGVHPASVVWWKQTELLLILETVKGVLSLKIIWPEHEAMNSHPQRSTNVDSISQSDKNSTSQTFLPQEKPLCCNYSAQAHLLYLFMFVMLSVAQTI
jgi:hypothetical protein